MAWEMETGTGREMEIWREMERRGDRDSRGTFKIEI